VANPVFNAWILAQNFEPNTNTPEEYAAVIRDSTAQWGATVNRLGIKID